MRVLALWLALPLALATAAQAGTPEAPEVVDPAGDQSVPSPAGDAHDVLAAWVAAAPHGKLSVSLRVAELTTQSSGVYEVLWAVGGPLAPDGDRVHAGVRYTLEAGQLEAAVLIDEGEGWVQPRIDVDADLFTGSPGVMEATFDPAEVRDLLGSTFHGFTAVARPPRVSVGVQVSAMGSLDTAAGDGRLAVPGPFRIGAIEVPPRAPDVGGEATPGVPGPADLTAAWMDRRDGEVVLTFRLRSLSGEEVAACESWGVSTFLSGEDDGLHVYVSASFDGPWLEMLYFSAEKEMGTPSGSRRVELPGNLTVQMGSPGYAQVRLADGEYSGPDLTDGAYSRVSANCQPGGTRVEDQIGGEPQYLPVTPAALLALGLVAAAAWRRRA